MPAEQPEMVDDEFLQKLHHVLLEVRTPLSSHIIAETVVWRLRPGARGGRQIHVEEGAMVCPNCKHVFPISNGIPNMVRFTLRLAL